MLKDGDSVCSGDIVSRMATPLLSLLSGTTYPLRLVIGLARRCNHPRPEKQNMTLLSRHVISAIVRHIITLISHGYLHIH